MVILLTRYFQVVMSLPKRVPKGTGGTPFRPFLGFSYQLDAHSTCTAGPTF
jgi:hypothetical protein